MCVFVKSVDDSWTQRGGSAVVFVCVCVCVCGFMCSGLENVC